MKPEGNLKKSPKYPEISESKDYKTWNINGQPGNEKVYTYDEAIDLAGNGMYIYKLLVVLAIALEGMALDMFGLSVVVSSACDLELTHTQKSILLSMPFVGSVLTSYPWGYVADTQGRLKGLTIALWGSFILASLSAFSPNWIVLALLRFGSSSFSSGIHSLSLTLLGESCSSKFKGPYVIGVTTLFFITFGVYSTCGHFVLNIEFAFDLGFIVFTPWRFLALVLAMPLGISAFSSLFFCESPKFVLNAGNEEKALRLLKKITEGNGVKFNEYPVKRVVLNEMTSLRKDIPLLQSLKDQIFPLFKPPLLYRSLQLYFITAVLYSTNNGFYSWLPFVVDRLNAGSADDVTSHNMCGMIGGYKELNDSSACIKAVTEFTMWIGLTQGAVYGALNFVVSWLSSRKKTVMVTLVSLSVVSGVSIPFCPGMIANIVLFNGYLLTSLCSSIVFSYFVDLFPTSYRGMAACLGVMVARISSLIGVNLIGTFLVSHCANSFFTASAFLFSGVIASVFLPPDKPKKMIEEK